MLELKVTKTGPFTAEVAGLSVDVYERAWGEDSEAVVEDLLAQGIEWALEDAGYTVMLHTYSEGKQYVTVA